MKTTKKPRLTHREPRVSCNYLVEFVLLVIGKLNFVCSLTFERTVIACSISFTLWKPQSKITSIDECAAFNQKYGNSSTNTTETTGYDTIDTTNSEEAKEDIGGRLFKYWRSLDFESLLGDSVDHSENNGNGNSENTDNVNPDNTDKQNSANNDNENSENNGNKNSETTDNENSETADNESLENTDNKNAHNIEETTTETSEAKTKGNENACSQHATCHDPNLQVKNDYECSCMDGFFGNGKNCTDYDECGLMTYECAEDEVCKNTPGSYDCEKCPKGYEKEPGANYCSDINECLNSTLFSCTEDLVCNNRPGTYQCNGCHDGFVFNEFTDECDDIDECENSSHDCNLEAVCRNKVPDPDAENPIYFTCTCIPGYTGDGYICTDVNECLLDPSETDCDPGIECVNVIGDHNCSVLYNGGKCLDGWYQNPAYDVKDPYGGTGRILPCLDIDECTDGPSSPCNRGMRCVNTDGSYECPGCKPGWQPLDTTTCQDINECFSGDHECSVPGGVCENSDGGYDCPRCDDGFTGPNGFNCTDINECENDPFPCKVGVECTNNDGSYHCGDCDSGYYLSPKGICFDINECTMGTHICARPGGICKNSDGGHECTGCEEGFNGTGVVCDDINECESSELNDCHSTGAMCINKVGSYRCVCRAGWFGSGKDCKDIDECAVGAHSCAPKGANCTNTDGSYECNQCLDGWNGNGFTCIDVNECLTGDHVCETNGTECSNTDGSYTCGFCQNGFLAGDSGACLDFDECSQGTHNCANPGGFCINEPGDFTCDGCLDGWTGTGFDCTDIDECAEGKIVSEGVNYWFRIARL